MTLLMCPKCGTKLPHPQHPLCKVYLCSCGGEIHHSAGKIYCIKCKRHYSVERNGRKYVYKVICPQQYKIEVKKWST